MWSRRSSTRTRLSSSLATRSATVRPKNPEPTTMRAGLGAVTPGDDTGADPSGPDPSGTRRADETDPSPSSRMSHRSPRALLPDGLRGPEQPGDQRNAADEGGERSHQRADRRRGDHLE